MQLAKVIDHVPNARIIVIYTDLTHNLNTSFSASIELLAN